MSAADQHGSDEPDYVDLGLDAVPYATPGLSRRPSRTIPPYTGISAGAGVLKLVAAVLYVCGAVAFALGVLLGSIAAIGASDRHGSPFAIGLAAVLQLAPFVAAGILLVAIGALVSMVAAVSLAVRDMAQNSYRA